MAKPDQGLAKKARTEWDPPARGEPAPERPNEENVQTGEEASRLLEQFMELYTQVSTSTDGVSPDITASFDTIVNFKLASGSSMGLRSPDLGAGSTLDDFSNFFDFPGCDEAKDTPDLVTTSSANPSPESAGSETDGHAADLIARARGMDGRSRSPLDQAIADRTRCSYYQGVEDGAESAYFNGMWDSALINPDTLWVIS